MILSVTFEDLLARSDYHMDGHTVRSVIWP